LEILSEEKPASFDIIFNDVDKVDYPRVLKLAVPRLKPGGLFITDNVLWSGRVADPKNAEPTTKAIREFNRLLFGSKELFASIVPLRDGVAVARKI
jgi:predicted O-methyltransferase YrrM